MISFVTQKNNKELMGDLIYSCSEQSFHYEPWMDNDFSIIIGSNYLGLDVSTAHNQVLQISGLSSKKLWKKSKLDFPSSFIGDLFFKGLETVSSGTGMSYGMEWETFFDGKGQVCIGDIKTTKTDTCVEFANGCVAVIDLNEQLKSIWLKPIFSA